MIAIIDYEAGNIRSVQNALGRLGCEYILTADPDEIRAADKVILPGVGNAAAALQSLRSRGLDRLIPRLRKPVLGICVGLQVLCRDSEEGPCEGLGLFDAHVRRFPSGPAGGQALSDCGTKTVRAVGKELSDCGGIPRQGSSQPPQSDSAFPSNPCLSNLCPPMEEQAVKVPHMGWNTLGNLDGKLFRELDGGCYVYFVHSYYPTLGPDTIATCRHGQTLFSAALRYENFYGTQFHPEKSGQVGERILRNFLSL